MAVYRISFDEGEGHIYRDANTIQEAVDMGIEYLDIPHKGEACIEKIERIGE